MTALSSDRLQEMDADACDRMVDEEKGRLSAWKPDFTPEEIRSLIEEVETLRNENVRLERTNTFLQTLRPHWAMGYNNASIAAQCLSGSLADIWTALGVEDQTSAMSAIRELTGPDFIEPEETPERDNVGLGGSF